MNPSFVIIFNIAALKITHKNTRAPIYTAFPTRLVIKRSISITRSKSTVMVIHVIRIEVMVLVRGDRALLAEAAALVYKVRVRFIGWRALVVVLTHLGEEVQIERAAV